MEGVSDVLQARQIALQMQVQTALMKKQLDVAKVQGDMVNEILEDAAQVGKAPGVGKKFDASM